MGLEPAWGPEDTARWTLDIPLSDRQRIDEAAAGPYAIANHAEMLNRVLPAGWRLKLTLYGLRDRLRRLFIRDQGRGKA